jgi:hypothetical protein
VKTRKGQARWDINIEQDGLHVVHVDPESGGVLKVARKIDDEAGRPHSERHRSCWHERHSPL